jgi:hypothetical protein
MMLLSFQAKANRLPWLGWPWLHGWFVGIVAVGTSDNDPLTLPAAHPLAMGAEIPVLLAIGMAGAANEVRLVKLDLLVTRSA